MFYVKILVLCKLKLVEAPLKTISGNPNQMWIFQL